MKVTFLVPDDDRHGVTRYARELAAGLGAQGADIEVDVLSVRRGSIRSAITQARRARSSTVVHLQLADGYWAEGHRQVLLAAALRVVLPKRRTVLTAHDFHTPHRRIPLKPHNTLAYLRGRRGVYDATTRLLVRSASIILTCTEAEGRNLGWAKPGRRAVIPLHVTPPCEPALHRTDVAEPRLVVLGWIHKRKGQHRAVEALAHLPGVQLYLAGAAPDRNREYLREVLERAAQLGVADRLVVTGFLPDDELAALLSTCRLALAPYERIAASASIATLLSSGLPVVALNNDYVRDIAVECPLSVNVYDRDDPAALALAVSHSLARPRTGQEAEARRWVTARSVDSVVALLRAEYCSLAASAA